MTRQALVLEDRPDTRRWLVDILARAIPDLNIRTACNLKAARHLLATEAGWHLALVDIGLPDGSGIELITEMRESHPLTDTIVTTIHDDDANLFGAIAAGARGYLLKSQPADILVRHLQQFEAGMPPLSPSIARRMLAWFSERPFPGAAPGNPDTRLSARDVEVLTCIGRGMRVAETARHLGLTESTVASYIKQLYRKLDINNRAEAALEAAKRGLV